MQLSEQDIQGIVSDATAKLKADLAANLTQKLDCVVTAEASEAVRKHVQQWVAENVIPDVTAILTEGKASLVNAATKSAEAMCDALAQSMKDTLAKKLEQSWDRKKVFEAMFT